MSKQNILNFTDEIHSRALTVSKIYQKAETELIEVLQQVDQHRVYLEKGHSSLFSYVVKELGLSESVTYNLIAVSRKATEIPELKVALQNREMTLSNARKIAPILNSENKSEWLKKASELSQRQLEKEIVRVHPRLGNPEKTTYVAASRVQVQIGLPEVEMLKLRRAQDLLSQKMRRSVSLEEVLIELTGDYLHRNDPVEKARRMIVKKGTGKSEPVAIQAQDLEQLKIENLEKLRVEEPLGEESLIEISSSESPSSFSKRNNRISIVADVLHQVRHRDQGRCTQLDTKGERCNQSRFVEIHHLKPVIEGGENTLQNLTTLCSAHHRFLHRKHGT